MSAPGTTTDTPTSPPMASSAIRTLWGMKVDPGSTFRRAGMVVLAGARRQAPDNSVSLKGHNTLVASERTGLTLGPAVVFLQRGKRRKRRRTSVAAWRRLEYRAGLAPV